MTTEPTPVSPDGGSAIPAWRGEAMLRIAELRAERDALQRQVDAVRVLAETQWCHHECSTAARVLAALSDGDTPEPSDTPDAFTDSLDSAGQAWSDGLEKVWPLGTSLAPEKGQS